MRNSNGCRLVLLLTPPLLFLFPVGVLVLALDRISNALLYEHTTRDYRTGSFHIKVYDSTSTDSDSTNTGVDLRIHRAPQFAILAICCLSYIVSAIGVFGIWELRRIEGTRSHQRVWSWLILISNTILIGASAGVLGYASSVQGKENIWRSSEDLGKGRAAFTKETWVCQIDRFYPNSGWAGPACGTTKATRYMLIPMAVSSALVLVSLWILVRERGGFKWLRGGKGRYGGFDDAYELEPTGPSAPYAFHPAPQWSPQPYQQWAPQPYQQWQPVPVQQWAPQPVQQMPQQLPQHTVSLTPDVSIKANPQVVFR
jgi:hypothetical protein